MKYARSTFLVFSLLLALAFAQDREQIFERYQEVAGRLSERPWSTSRAGPS